MRIPTPRTVERGGGKSPRHSLLVHERRHRWHGVGCVAELGVAGSGRRRADCHVGAGARNPRRVDCSAMMPRKRFTATFVSRCAVRARPSWNSQVAISIWHPRESRRLEAAAPWRDAVLWGRPPYGEPVSVLPRKFAALSRSRRACCRDSLRLPRDLDRRRIGCCSTAFSSCLGAIIRCRTCTSASG